MITNTRTLIIDYIQKHEQARPDDLQKALHISNVALHKQLKNLLNQGLIARLGKPPVVFYKLAQQETAPLSLDIASIPAIIQTRINTSFLSITPDGKLLYGMDGFAYWRQIYQKTKSLRELAQLYAQTLEADQAHRTQEGWIDATSKLSQSFKDIAISHLFFQDRYSYPLFGRTKLAKLVMYAKQTGEKRLIEEITRLSRPILLKILQKYDIEAIVFIPPTIPRPIQFMHEYAQNLALPLPEIKLTKIVAGDIPIPQKTLSTTQERVINAQNTIFLKNTEYPSYKRVLLVDDVAGSGASLNVTAKKLRVKNIGMEEIIGYSLVGNIKGFDVIRDI